MARIDNSYFDIGYTDFLSRQETVIHRLDPRVKLITTMVFIIMVVSFGKYELSNLVPFLIYPLFLCFAGNIPFRYLLKRIVLVSPFALMIGIFNPLIDTHVAFRIGEIAISTGWISFFSILLRFILTVSAALALIAVTGFNQVCMAMEKLAIPRVFVVQLMFLYRYLFVLMGEGTRMFRASRLRNPGKRGIELKTFASLLGHLLLRTLDRAKRIHLAMHCRGFDGEIKTLGLHRLGPADVLFLLIWTVLFIMLRFFSIHRLLGELVLRGLF